MARQHRSRVLLAVLVVLLIAVAGIGTWFALRPGTNAARPGAGRTPQAQTVRAELTTQQRTVSANGTIAPRSQANLNFAVSGTVTAVTARVGQQVSRGAPLAQLDRTQLESSLELAQAQLDAAAANSSQLRDSGNATSAQLSSADAQVTSATAKRDQARQSLSDAQLSSPIDGTVALVNIAAGDKVAAGQSNSSGLGTSNTGNTGGSSGSSQGGSGQAGSGQGGSGQGGSGQGSNAQSGSQAGSSQAGSQAGSSQAGSGQAAQIVVIATDAWLVNAQVTAADLPQIKQDQPVEITPSGSTDKVPGTVAQVGVMASSSSSAQTATFPVTIAVTGNRSGLYAGGSASVSITIRQYTDILTVPTAAILTEDQKTVVHQLVGGRQVTTAVTVGQVFGTLTQITGGLKEGDEVLVSGRSFSRPATPNSGGFGPRRGGG